MGRIHSDLQLSKLRRQVHENLIDRELLYQESQKKKIKVDEEAIDKQIGVLKKRFTTEAEFKEALSRANLSEATLRSQIKRRIAIQKFIDEQFGQKIVVSDKEVKSYYDSHLSLFKEPEQVRASHILIKVDPQADKSHKAKARKKIEEVQQRFKSGEDFAALAKEFSQCPSSAKGGDLGYFKRGEMVKPFEKVAFALKPGEVSDIVETRFGYHLIKVTDKKPETIIAYEGVKERLKRHLKEQKIRREIGIYVGKLKERAKVERFLEEHP